MNSCDDETEPLGEAPELTAIGATDRITNQAKAIEAIRVARSDYEAALARREHGAVAADRFITAVTAQIDGLS